MITMAKWKPTFWRTNGRPGATASVRKVGRKFLDNMKHRNEELGNYINPVQRFQYDGIKFVMSSLPGYDIIDITVPFVPDEEEVGGAAEIYSGLWEPRHNVNNLGYYLRWYPAAYEIYNSDSTAPVGLGASVDGAAEELLPTIRPPGRWLRNSYIYDPEDPTTHEEAPWFKDTGPVVSAASIHPGRYSGKLRELVQMQLGYGLLPQFSYTASDSNGIHLETLDEDTTRIWLYQISATNGIVMQVMLDYTAANFEREAELKSGSIPPEIEEAGFMALQTSFDSSRPVYTKSEWDALPADEQPSIRLVTFELLSAPAYLSSTEEYGAYGDYGWSFNPAGTRAVICGIAWNTVTPGVPALNYKSNILTITLNPTAFTASVSGSGDTPFLMAATDHVKFPNADGTLQSQYFYKGENGFNGTQPSSSYTSPIYAYYDLNGALVQCDYSYNAGFAENDDPEGSVLDWADTIACQGTCTVGSRFEYSSCTTGQSGTGTMGQKHGFSTSITAPDIFAAFSGGKSSFSGVVSWGGWYPSLWKSIFHGVGGQQKAALHVDSQYVAVRRGSWSATSTSVLIIPSFERLGFYHYKKLNTVLSSGTLRHPYGWFYELGTPTRFYGTGTDTGCDTDCPLGTGKDASLAPDEDTEGYYVSDEMIGTVGPKTRNLHTVQEACGVDDEGGPVDCFLDSEVPPVATNIPPPDQDPATFDDTTYVGGLMLPDGSSTLFSDDEIVNQSEPFRESSGSFGYQSVISCFDTFSGKYIFSMPNIALTATKHTATGFPNDFTKIGVLFSGMPYFTE